MNFRRWDNILPSETNSFFSWLWRPPSPPEAQLSAAAAQHPTVLQHHHLLRRWLPERNRWVNLPPSGSAVRKADITGSGDRLKTLVPIFSNGVQQRFLFFKQSSFWFSSAHANREVDPPPNPSSLLRGNGSEYLLGDGLSFFTGVSSTREIRTLSLKSGSVVGTGFWLFVL